MTILYGTAVLLAAYLIGSIPSGLIIVRLITGKDVRTIESGRTGGTNVMRAAGFWAGLGTAIFDMLKAAVTVWLARGLFPQNVWLHILAPIGAILGHNFSIYLVERMEDGRLRFRGGAGGAACVGGSFGLWAPSLLIILPLSAVSLYFIGYASLSTLIAALLSTLVFVIRAWVGASQWQYALYGLIACVLLAWSLRPNIKRLLNGTERLVGFRARRAKDSEQVPKATNDEK